MHCVVLAVLAVVVVLLALNAHLAWAATSGEAKTPREWALLPFSPEPYRRLVAPAAPERFSADIIRKRCGDGVKDFDPESPVLLTWCRQAKCDSAALGAETCACVNSVMPDPATATACCLRGGGAGCAPGAWLQYAPTPTSPVW